MHRKHAGCRLHGKCAPVHEAWGASPSLTTPFTTLVARLLPTPAYNPCPSQRPSRGTAPLARAGKEADSMEPTPCLAQCCFCENPSEARSKIV